VRYICLEKKNMKAKATSFGPYFKKLRRSAGLSLDKLSEVSKIPKYHLERLEREEFEKLPPTVYVRGFIVKCCGVFNAGDSVSELQRLYDQQNAPYMKDTDHKEIGHKVAMPFSITPQHIRWLGIFLFLFFVGLYLFIRFIPYFFAPGIILEKPVTENVVVNFSEIEVRGSAINTSLLTLNGEEMYIEENGEFTSKVDLEEGINRLVFEAHSRFGRKAEIVRRVVYIKNSQDE